MQAHSLVRQPANFEARSFGKHSRSSLWHDEAASRLAHHGWEDLRIYLTNPSIWTRGSRHGAFSRSRILDPSLTITYTAHVDGSQWRLLSSGDGLVLRDVLLRQSFFLGAHASVQEELSGPSREHPRYGIRHGAEFEGWDSEASHHAIDPCRLGRGMRGPPPERVDLASKAKEQERVDFSGTLLRVSLRFIVLIGLGR